MINFNYQVPLPSLRNRNRLKQYLILLCKKEQKAIDEISFVFCSDDYLLSLNQQFLNHDTYTDIISFDYTPKGGPIKGEIYISIDRVKENASVFESSFTYELHRVIFHGVLHFCGYKDKLKADQTIMRAKEEFYLGKYFS